MLKQRFRATTALVATLALGFPQATLAQDAAPEGEGPVLMCLDGTIPPCPEGEPTEGTPVDEGEVPGDAGLNDAAEIDAQATEDAIDEAGDAEVEAEVDAEAEAEAATGAEPMEGMAEEAPAAADDAAAPAMEPGTGAAPVAADEDGMMPEGAEGMLPESTEGMMGEGADGMMPEGAEADSDMTGEAPEAAAETGAEAEAMGAEGEDLPLEDAVDDVPAPETTPDAEAADPGPATLPDAGADVTEESQTGAAAATEAEVDAEATVEPDAAAETEGGDEAEAETEAEAEAEATMEAEATDADAAADAEAAAATDAAVEEEGAPAAAMADDAEPAEVTETVVDEEMLRTSDEDFETTVTGDASPTATEGEAEVAATSDDDDDDGMSNFERALLLGLGAVAVGSLLDNGGEVVSNSGDRVVVERNGEYEVYKDDNALLFQPGSNVRTETFSDGSTRTFIDRADGSQIITIRDNRGNVLRRTRILADGTEILLFDDTGQSAPIDTAELQAAEDAGVIDFSNVDEQALRDALAAEAAYDPGRRFSLRQIRTNEEVRSLVPSIDLDTINFASGSAAIPEAQARDLVRLGTAMEDMLANDPREVFLVEGHTDAVGNAPYNLALSDRRAESVALALTEYFDIPPENLVVQGYGERFLKVPTETAEQANRRATVRRITPLLQTAAAN